MKKIITSKAGLRADHNTDQPTEQEFVITVDGANDGSQAGPGQAVPYSIRQFPMKVPENTQNRKRRPRSPGLKWFKQYDGPGCFKSGRVLVIDYIKQGPWEIKMLAGRAKLTSSEQSKQGMRKVAAQEFDSIRGLRRLYSTVRHMIMSSTDL